ncbi:MAG: RyR domain-containing protein [Planctomycetota bacterium]
MRRLYLLFRFLSRRWLSLVVILIILTMACGTCGYYRISPDADHPISNDLYHSLHFFQLDCDAEDGELNGWLRAARWCGFAVWSVTIVGVLGEYFRERLYGLLVLVSGRNHVILCGLGDPDEDRDQLVDLVIQDGHSVVVLEPDANHPTLEACRELGAVCLQGAGRRAFDLKRARIRRAHAVIVLGESDRANIDVIAAAQKLLSEIKSSEADTVKCLVQTNEPTLLDVLRRHDAHTNPYDRLDLQLFSRHEMAARAMLRESTVDRTRDANARIVRETIEFQKILVVGIGKHGRMGEALVTRATKDRAIEDGHGNLEIHVVDEDADEWVRCLTERTTYLRDVQAILPVPLPAARCGLVPDTGENRTTGNWQGLVDEKYDAVFVCLSDEALAVVQATRIADMLRDGGQEQTPVVVRVQEEDAGLGGLLAGPAAGGLGQNLRPIGTHDRLYDLIATMDPKLEILAQAFHQDYLALHQERIQQEPDPDKKIELRSKAAYVPWRLLPEKYRDANRQLALRRDGFLRIPAATGARRYQAAFRPSELINPTLSYQLDDAELELLAKTEHGSWLADRAKKGWRLGHADDDPNPPKGITYNPNMKPWEQLDDATKEYDRNIIRRLAGVLAKADYKLVQHHSH